MEKGTSPSSSDTSEQDRPSALLDYSQKRLRDDNGNTSSYINEMYISSSREKKNTSVDTDSPLSNTGKDNDSSSSDTSEQDRSSALLDYSQTSQTESAEKEQNASVPPPITNNKTFLKSSLLTNYLSSQKSVDVSSSDTKDEVYTSLTPSPLPGTIDQANKKFKGAISDISSSSSNSLGSNKIEKGYNKHTHLSERTKMFVPRDQGEQKNQRLQGGEKAPDYLTSATDSIIYRDYSHIKPHTPNPIRRKNPRFPEKLHQILSHPDSKEWIVWLPHGRAWKILDQAQFEDKVLPRFFQHGKLMSFMRQVSHFGFKRVPSGPDKNSYYHE
eukprot:15366714-Ditylum_brightwellii.AAC.1